MTASAPITGNLRAIPDAASVPPPDSGVPTHANFRSVLEQYHSSRESASNSDDTQDAPQQKQKDSDPTNSLAVPLPVTPAVEAPRLILPFTSSITLRQDAPASPASPDETTTQDSTAAADPNGVPSGIVYTLSTPANLRNTLNLRNFPPENDTKTNTAPSGAQPKSQAKLQAKLQDLVPSQAVAVPLSPTTPADPSTPLLPVPSSTIFEPAGTAVQNSSTVNESSNTVSTSTLDRGASLLATSRNAAYQYRFSQESDSATVAASRTAQQQPNISDPTATITAPVTVTEAVDPQRLIHPSAGSNTPRQDAPVLQSSSAVTQDSSAGSGTDPKTVLPPALEPAENTTAVPPVGSLAFAARLTPTEEMQPAAPDASRAADSQSRAQTAWQAAPPATVKQISSEADLTADAHSGQGGSQEREKASDLFAKPETLLPQTHATTPDQTVTLATSHTSTSQLSPAARMDQVQEPPATAPSGNHDITIRIPDATNDQGTAVRFVERAGEVHVSVRTGDAEMAQTLRGGLNDLVNRLEDGGIRTQVWQPSTDSSTSQNDSHHPSADPDGSHDRQYSSGSNSEQESKQQNRPRWVEELEGSIGSQNPKETPQLWQA